MIWTATAGQGRAASVDPAAQAAYRRLLQTVGLNPQLAESTARAMLQAAQGGSGSDGGRAAPRPLDSVQGLLSLPGYTPEMVAVLEPFVTVLPERTLVNANTAEAEVLAAVIDKLPLERARELVRQRDRAYFNNVGNVQTQLAAVAPQADSASLANMIDVRSHYFLVYGLVRHERASRLQVSLIFRGEPLGATNTTRVVWIQDADRLPDLR
ncbi:General secretion pathway protein K [compost metagenome]